MAQARWRRSFGSHGSLARFAGAGCLLLLFTVPVHGQTVLYDNGPDEDIGYYRVNFGAATTNSFALAQEATVTNVVLTIYDVDDRNFPEHLKWTITTEPFGGSVLGTGFVGLSRLQPPYLTRFLFFAWKTGFQVPSLTLPAGTFYLQLQDVVTEWDTWAFWAESGGPSTAYHSEVGPSNDGVRLAAQTVSESFVVMGEWREAAQQ